jgi:predicted outer membrane repeat protein
MSLSSWLRNLHSAGRHQSAGRFRPRLEALEERWLPSQVSLTVTSLGDSGAGTLRDAIQTADNGKQSDKYTIGFAVNGTIDLQSPLPDLNNNIAIQGPGASSLTVQRDSGVLFTSAIVTVDVGQTASLSGLTIANGTAPDLVDFGGGIHNLGTLTVSGCTLSGNSATASGAAVFNQGTMTVVGSMVSGNSAARGAIFNDGTMTVVDSTLSGNTAGDKGGAFTNFGTATLSGCTLCGNTASDSGGAIYNANNLPLTISGCTLSGNSAGFGGGAIYNFSSPLALTGSTLSGNTARLGGGIYEAFGTLTVSGSTFSGNTASDSGGAIYNSDFGVDTVRDSLFTGNSAKFGGGIAYQVFNLDLGTLNVRGSTFSGNSASDSGGAIYNNGTAMVQQCTFSGNTAGSDGGGIFNGASGNLTIDDSVLLTDLALIGADLYNLGTVLLHDSSVGMIGP